MECPEEKIFPLILKKSRTFQGILLFIFLYTVFPLSAEEENPRINDAVKAVAIAMPSVVNLSADQNFIKNIDSGLVSGSGADSKKDDAPGTTMKSIGSGSIIDKSGIILTSSHVILDAPLVTVTLYDGTKHQARTIANDTLQDMALLKIDELKSSPPLVPIRTSPPGELYIGETAIAVGNPYGLGSSITRGVLSATGRKIIYKGKVLFSDIIQIDTPIFPGNSGGPLINILGEMMGMNTSTHKEAPGIGFAIPVERLEKTMAAWLTPERINNLSLGIIPGQKQISPGTYEISIENVMKNSPAWNAGLRPGNIIRKYESFNAKDLLEFSRYLISIKQEKTITLQVKDKGTVKLKTIPLQIDNGQKTAMEKLGIGVQKLNKQLASALGYNYEQGVIIADVFDQIPQLKRGDLLARLGDMPIHSFNDISKAMLFYQDNDEIEALIITPDKAAGALSRNTIMLKIKGDHANG